MSRPSEVPVPYMMHSTDPLENPALVITATSNVEEQLFQTVIEMDDEELNQLVNHATAAGMSPGEYLRALIYSATEIGYRLLPIPLNS